MNLNKKKALASRVLKIGKKRIVFNINNLNEIKEAITKQDIRDLVANSSIIIKSPKGRKKIVKRNLRRRGGSVRKKIKTGKQDYVKRVRKLRAYLKELRSHDKVSDENYWKIRKELKASIHKTKHHVQERISQL
ncbi:MAG: 50S ribosomal protein L19e [archaeon]|nr:50S ribosomal protein L19e [archaeon]